MEENNRQKQHETEQVTQDKHELWFVKMVKTYAKEKPKQAFMVMFSLVVLSVLISITHLIYVRQVEVPRYKQMRKVNIFQGAENTISEPIDAAQHALELRDVMKELDYYKVKPELTRQDSIRIKYLIDKYN